MIRHFRVPKKESIELYSLLPEGIDKAVSMQRLADITGTTARQVRREIFNLRLAGKIIAGDSNGYYIPANEAELLAYYRTALARGMATMASIESARAALLLAGIDTESEGSR